jgi:hypothetical protein
VVPDTARDTHLHTAWHQHHIVSLVQDAFDPVARDGPNAYPPVQVAHQRDLEALQQQQQQQCSCYEI